MSNEAKHTPGPWTADTRDLESPCVWAGGELCCLLYQDVTTDDYIGFGRELEPLPNAAANAHLIAAAPELLEALKDVFQHLPDAVAAGFGPRELVAQARDAIDKAEGRA